MNALERHAQESEARIKENNPEYYERMMEQREQMALDEKAGNVVITITLIITVVVTLFVIAVSRGVIF